MIHIIASNSSRLEYVCRQVFNRWLGIDFLICKQDEIKADANDPVVNYTNSVVSNAINITPFGLMHKTGISDINPTWEEGHLFPTPCGFGFDIFSAVFYLISRHEEYGSRDTDKHGRYKPENSTLFKQGLLQTPVVDKWVDELRLALNDKFNLSIPKHNPENLTTVDVDNVYAFRNKGIFRHILSSTKDLIKGNKASAAKRWKSVSHIEDDPFFNIEEVAQRLADENPNNAIFFHCGCYGKFDKKTIVPSLRYWKAKQRIDKQIVVGLHISYRAATNDTALKLEKWALEKCLGRSVTKCRFHYLKFALPYGYERLEAIGITDDYSMAYSNVAGYRAGTSRSFAFYNIEKEKECKLTVHPLIVMDKTLRSNMGFSVEKAYEYIDTLRKGCNDAGGDFTTLFHNENVADLDGWKEWGDRFFSRQ
ncbi:MAG: hypothetical protein KBT22_00185 [Bacteroidales bacterium]|nr:hypothetical protein [Candidatus Scybalocola fimicaballi]